MTPSSSILRRIAAWFQRLPAGSTEGVAQPTGVTEAATTSIPEELRQPLARVRQGVRSIEELLSAHGDRLDAAQAQALRGHLARGEQALQQGLQVLGPSQRAGEGGAAFRLAGRRILLADDSAFHRKAIAASLRSAAVLVIEVEHGQAVLEQLRAQEGIDAVIVDLHMPGMDGLETARAVRGCGEPWSRVPVVALSARASEGALATAAAAGVNALLVKPLDAALLYDTLHRLLGSAPAAQRLPVQEPREPASPPPTEEALLNLQRLESYKRLGMIDELLDDYLPEMARLIESLQQAVRAGDLQASTAVLHSLLGMSGEAGAQALYQQVRRIYVPLLEQKQWPGNAAWLGQLQELAGRTEEALKAYCAQQAPSGAD